MPCARRDPAVVPQLKTITLGARAPASASSLPRIATAWCTTACSSSKSCSATAASSPAPRQRACRFFFGFPNSYGTLGYALRVKVKTVPVSRSSAFNTQNSRIHSSFFEELGARLKAGEADFIDGTVFNPGQFFITLGSFADSAPYTSDYTYESIYYQSIRGKREGLPHGARLSVALGHRLVLVLERTFLRSIP